MRTEGASLVRHWTGKALVSVAAVAAVTGVVYLLRDFVPVLSLGTLYVLAVLPVAVFLGSAYAVVVSIMSMLAFNYFLLPPVGTFTLSGEENWLTLAVFLVTGLIVAALAATSRRRARLAEQREREAALLAEAAAVLLSGAEVSGELNRVADGAARVLLVRTARIELGSKAMPRADETALALRSGGRRVGTLYVSGARGPSLAARRRFLDALASLLAVAIQREELTQEALEAEALRRSDSLKTAILRAVSHDLRSPLTAIQAALEGLQSSSLDLGRADRERLLATALAGTRQLNRVVRNLLDLSRLQAGAARSEPTLRPIEGLVDQALVHVAAHRRVDVLVPPDLPLVRVDPVQVEHALVNLLENALKFSPADSRVAVDVENLAGEVVVRVADRGPGLGAGEGEVVFEPFRHAATASGRKGAGLGLAIAKGFVEANGGRIWAESSPGEGASFFLAFPGATETAQAAERAEAGAET